MGNSEKIVELFDNLYGRDFGSRILKLREECAELIEVIDAVPNAPKDGHFDRLQDEMSDVLAVLTHVADIMNIQNGTDGLLQAAIAKVMTRAENPDYHNSFLYLCPDCNVVLHVFKCWKGINKIEVMPTLF